MAENSSYSTVVTVLRRIRPLHSVLRAIRNCISTLIVEFFRRAGGRTFRMGGGRGFFPASEVTGTEGKIIMAEQKLRAASADGLRKRMNQSGWQPWPIFWKRFPHARLVAESLALMDDRKRVMFESAGGATFADSDPAARYLLLPKTVKLNGPWTCIVDRWSQGTGYYHWLMESLPRLAVLDEFPTGTRIIVPRHLKSFQCASLDCMGLMERCSPAPGTHLVVEDYYFSSPTAMTGCDNPYAIEFLRDQFLKHADPSGPVCDKLFIQRRGKTRGISNSLEVSRFFEEHGWAILDMEDLTFAQQIRLFSQVRVVCGLHGAAFTNLLWCQPGASVLELCASNFVNGCYEGIASYVGVNHRHIIFPGDHRFTIEVDVKVLELMLAEMNGL